MTYPIMKVKESTRRYSFTKATETRLIENTGSSKPRDPVAKGN